MNNEDVFRIKSRQLSETELSKITQIKTVADILLKLIEETGNNREVSLAKTKLEETVMWAVKGISG